MKFPFFFILVVVLFVLLIVATVTVEAAVPSDQLIAALTQVESGGDDNAIGDKHLAQKAYGCLQIRQPAVDDVNRLKGTNYKAEDCLGNRALSIWICKVYIDNYATPKRLGTVNDEKMARIWNGGPNGWKRSSTQAYWEKVRQALSD